jgi:hypothetical protein
LSGTGIATFAGWKEISRRRHETTDRTVHSDFDCGDAVGGAAAEGSGEFKTREVLRQGLTAFLILPTYKIKKIEDEDGAKHKFWWLFEAGNIGLNAGVIAQNAGKHYGPKRDRD